jgi:hypothetical protein
VFAARGVALGDGRAEHVRARRGERDAASGETGGPFSIVLVAAALVVWNGMKTTLLSLAALVALAVAVAGGGRPTTPTAAAQSPAQPDPRAKDAEPLRDFPLLDPKNKVVALNPAKTLFAEVAPGEKPRVVRVGVVCEVCLREGPLEVFLCRTGTKEHESIVRADLDGQQIHAALNAAGAKEGTPTQFVNRKTNLPEYKPATGTKIKVSVHYRKDAKVHTHPAQDWVLNMKTKKPMDYGWVFAGSQLIRDPDDPDRKPFYGANSGEFISISNFPYSMLEIPADVSKDDANLMFEARTERIPPLLSKVWVILEPVPARP